jgi:ubiquinone/menaquinone biosynthesis C-methylase UbiE
MCISCLYERHLLPWVLDLACGLSPISRQRAQVVPGARGRVLEVGIGTGLNMPHYDVLGVESLTGVDPALQMHALARRRAQRAGLDVQLIGLSAEDRLPVEDASFDTVVMTYTLCSIPDAVAALREIRRVLAPGGRLLFCEHGRAPDASVRRWQDRLQRWWGPMAGGCQLGRDIPALLREGGFITEPMQEGYLRGGPRPLAYNYWGAAVPAN